MVQVALDALNEQLPHYRQIRNFKILSAPLTAENGLLTAMGKLRRDAFNARYEAEINAMYELNREREQAGTRQQAPAVNRQHA